MNSTRNKRLLVSFLMTLCLSTNSTSVRASWSEIKDNLHFGDSKKPGEIQNLNGLVEKIHSSINSIKSVDGFDGKSLYEFMHYILERYSDICGSLIQNLENIKENREKNKNYSILYKKIIAKKYEDNSKNIIEICPNKNNKELYTPTGESKINENKIGSLKEKIRQMHKWFKCVKEDICGGNYTVWNKNIKSALKELVALNNMLNMSLSCKNSFVLKYKNDISIKFKLEDNAFKELQDNICFDFCNAKENIEVVNIYGTFLDNLKTDDILLNENLNKPNITKENEEEIKKKIIDAFEEKSKMTCVNDIIEDNDQPFFTICV